MSPPARAAAQGRDRRPDGPEAPHAAAARELRGASSTKLVEGAARRSSSRTSSTRSTRRRGGAPGMNAAPTRTDLLLRQLPANKLELWFWMESDRLAQPGLPRVLLRARRGPGGAPAALESTPDAAWSSEEFNAMFWMAHPVQLGRSSAGRATSAQVDARAGQRVLRDLLRARTTSPRSLVGDFEPEKRLGPRREVLRPHPANPQGGARGRSRSSRRSPPRSG